MVLKLGQAVVFRAWDTGHGRAAQLFLCLVVCLAALLSPARAEEQASDWVRTENAILRLVSAWDAIGPDGQALIGVQVRMSPGWKTYWRWPGESGVPTKFDWSGSTNLSRLDVHWPAPQRSSEYEMQTFSYADEVIFPVSITSESPTKPVELNLRLSYGVCKDVCVPMESRLRMVLAPSESAGGPTRTVHARHIERFGKKVPGKNGDQGLSIEGIVLRQSDDGNELELRAHSETPLSWPDVAIIAPPTYRLGVPLVDLSYNRRDVRLRMPLISRPGAPALVGSALSVVMWDEDGRSVESSVIVQAAPAPPSD